MQNEIPKVPKTIEEELRQLIDDTNFVLSNTSGKSNPLRALHREGKLTFEYVLNEIERIAGHKSDLSAGRRAAVQALFYTAVRQFEERQNKDASENKQA